MIGTTSDALPIIAAVIVTRNFFIIVSEFGHVPPHARYCALVRVLAMNPY
jgi:hypothetical protein